MKLSVSWLGDEIPQRRAQQLAAELELPLLHTDLRASSQPGSRRAQTEVAGDLLLVFDPQGLSLRAQGRAAPGPLRVSFEQGREAWRLRHGGGRSQLIARALGLHKSAQRPHILDATAGLGGDAFLLAGLGCSVILLERSAVIAALLADGLQRLGQSDDAELRSVAGRMALLQCDALDYLHRADAIDMIYLDPMFPEHGRAARVKKEMQLLRQLLPPAPQPAMEEQALLAAALRVARHRVVVKRMKKSPVITGSPPSYQLSGKSVRYDVYALRRFA